MSWISWKMSRMKDCRALGNDVKQEMGYHHKHSQEPLLLLSDSTTSRLWAGRWVAWLQNPLHGEGERLETYSFFLSDCEPSSAYTVIFFSFICLRRLGKERLTASSDDPPRITQRYVPHFSLFWITLAFGIRKALPKISKNRSSSTRNKAVSWGKEQFLHH